MFSQGEEHERDKKKYFIPTAQWFQNQTNEFEKRWADAPWHEKGEKNLKPIINSIRKYASFINKLPENFLPRVFDQHLAVLSEGYEYHILDILDDLEDDRYLCKNNNGIYFCVWSHGITQNYREGVRTVMLALIPLDKDSVLSEVSEEKHTIENYIPAITYGPILG